MEENKKDLDIDSKCGFVAIVGRPNVGKSTLLNRLIGEKISITADKPQTTQHKILGIKTIAVAQAVYIDTPGIHSFNKKKINQYMNKAAYSALRDVDIIVFLVEALGWQAEDELVLDKIRKFNKANKPVILVVNKIDLQKDKDLLLPYLDKLAKKFQFFAFVPMAAKKDLQVAELQTIIFNMLPTNPHFFPAEQITSNPIKFRLAEILREKLIRTLAKELPYALMVEIEHFEQQEQKMVIHAVIWVERDSQKKIVIGKGGEKLKHVGRQARLAMNKMLNCRVHLQIWVKVRSGWTDDDQALQNFGYMDN